MAVTTVTTTMAGAINYTVVTDTSADWPSVANSTYFYDKATKLVYFKNSSGTVLEIFSEGGGSAITLTSAGGTETLVNDGSGPSLAVKGLTGGAGVTLSSNASSISIASDNIYNTDGTLSGNRTVTMGSNTLTFDGTDSNLLYQPNSTGGDFRLDGQASGLPAFTITVPANVPLGKNQAGVQFGIRAWDDPTFSGYGAVGDGFVYSGNNSNGLNIISSPGTGTADYIRLFAGQTASGTADIHIQGTGLTRGFVGIGTNSPTADLDVIGKVKATGLQVTTSPTAGYVLTSDASGNATWQTVGAGGTGFSATLNFQTQVLATSASNTTYVIGGNANYAPGLLANDSPRYRVRTPIGGSIKSVQFSIYIQGTFAGSGNVTLRVVNVTQNTFENLTTTYTMSSGALQGGARNDHFVLASPLAVNEGDEIQIRLITPTWITAPTNIFHNGQVYITN